MQPPGPVNPEIVLLGAGPAHIEVLRHFALRPEPGVRLTLLARQPETPHPAMLPGLLRGDYTAAEAHIDLGPLTAAAGARLIMATADAIDLTDRLVAIAGRPALPFDLLSIDLDGQTALCEQIAALEAGQPDGARIAVIGGGAATIELTLALAHRFAGRFQLVLVCETPEPLDSAPPRARRAARTALVDAGVELACGVSAGGLIDGRLGLSDGSFLDVDAALSITVAPAAPLFADAGWACDDGGHIKLDASLRCISHDRVFAAVEADGARLAINLRRAAWGKTPRTWRPRRARPAMLSLGGGRGLAWWNGIAVAGPAVWRGKDWIDRNWIRTHAVRLPPPKQPPNRGESDDGNVLLSGALATLRRMPGANMLVGRNTPEGAAVLTLPLGQVLVQSVDCLPALLDDPFVFGQVAAAHALAELHAMGARPWTALAIATVPHGASIARRQTELAAMLAGATSVLETDGCTLVGGHTAEAAQPSLGFAVSGLAEPSKLLGKTGLRPGDVLVLTKGLGTGIVLAGHRRGEAQAAWLLAAIDSMRRSNAAAARVVRGHGATACTSVNGQGLTGHLADMLGASRAAAVLWADAIPTLPGAMELAGDNADAALLADPQTSGGLLVGVPRGRAEQCLAALHQVGLTAAIIGVVEALAPGVPTIRLQRD